MAWRLASPGEVYDAQEGSVVYFDPHSGDTHLITDFAAYLLQELAQGALNTDELCQRASPLIEESEPEHVVEFISSTLTELVALGIVEPE